MTFGRKGGFNASKIWETLYGQPLTLGDQAFQRVCQKCSESGDPDDPVDLHVSLPGSNFLNFTDEFNMTIPVVEFNIKDKNGDLMTNFQLEGVNFDMSISSQPQIT